MKKRGICNFNVYGGIVYGGIVGRMKENEEYAMLNVFGGGKEDVPEGWKENQVNI